MIHELTIDRQAAELDALRLEIAELRNRVSAWSAYTAGLLRGGDIVRADLARVRAERDHFANLVVTADQVGAYGRPRERADAIERAIGELIINAGRWAIFADVAAALAAHDRKDRR